MVKVFQGREYCIPFLDHPNAMHWIVSVSKLGATERLNRVEAQMLGMKGA
jgi:hypothetical protein